MAGTRHRRHRLDNPEIDVLFRRFDSDGEFRKSSDSRAAGSDTIVSDREQLLQKGPVMRRFQWFVVMSVIAFLIAACSRSRQTDQVLRPTATIKDIMDSLVDPSADALWESVATIVTASGTDERAPKTDEEWANVRRHAVRLVEATNLLLMDGRHVASASDKSQNPNIELEPGQIETLIAQDRQAWIKFAHGLHDAAVPALKAIDAKNAAGLLDAGEGIDTACENCHLKYWYPNTQQAEAAAVKK